MFATINRRAARGGGPAGFRAAAALSAAFVVLGPVGTAAADPFDVRLIPPNVLLILDSSGSMEYLRQEHRVPRCAGDPTRDDPNQRTRWMKVMDALLGPVDDDAYFCERFIRGAAIPYSGGFTLPSDWILPHFLPCGVRDGRGRCDPTASRNIAYGILERYRERVRFGVSTFDSFFGTQGDASGMWSYGGESLSWFDPARSMTVSVNAGIKGTDGAACDDPNPAAPNPACVPGAFVKWGGDATDINALNGLARRSVTRSVPYCGSPVSAAFSDARHYFLTDTDNLAPVNFGTDRYWACRQRYVILVTDGLPNTGEGNPRGTGPYPSSEGSAASLYNILGPSNVPVYVIGFSLCPGGTTEGDEVRRVLDSIALQGCPVADPRCPGRAYTADETDDLIAALDRVLYRASSGVTSRTLALTTNQTVANDPPAVVQYEFNTALRANASDPWEGIVERIGFVCNGSGEIVPSPAVSDYTDYGRQLNNRILPREIRTVTDPVLGARLVQRPTPFTSPVAFEPFTTANPNVTDAQLGEPGRTAVDGGAWVRSVVNYMHGAAGTPRAGRRLADVYHASASLIGRPNLEIPIVSYYEYQRTRYNRLQVLYAATNDGVLHAFRANDDTPDLSKRGEELWAYLPNALLKQVPLQITSGHMANLDATPIARDVRIFKDGDAATSDNDWRSVIAGGYRQGGRGYYALDVTDPAAPTLLWEITDETEDSSTAGTGDYANLWLSYATPLPGVVFTANADIGGSPLGEVAATIFPGGYRPVDPVRSTTDLYVVSTRTGRLIRKLAPRFPTEYACGGADCGTKPECCAQLITSPVGYGALPGLLTTRVFIGDDRGRIWRADLASTNPADWVLDLFYPHPRPPTGDPSPPYGCTTCTRKVGAPVKFPPAIALDRQNRLVLIFGTGDIDNVPQADQSYLFSVTEELEYDSLARQYLGRAHYNWHETLEVGEKITGVPIVFNKVAYLSTFTPSVDPSNACALGAGRIWGVVYNTKDPDGNGDTSDWGALDDDGLVGGSASLRQSFANTYVAGVNVLQRPSCMDGVTPPTPGLSAGSTDKFELVAQVSGGSSSGAPIGAAGQVPVIRIQIPTPPVSNYADSWGAVFE